MAGQEGRADEGDLERTDRLPIFVSEPLDPDVSDDAVRLEFSPVFPSLTGGHRPPALRGFAATAPNLRLPDSALLVRDLERARADNSAAAAALAELEARLADANSRLDDLTHSAERQLGAIQSLNEALNAREQDLKEARQSVSEREAEIQALQRAHAAELLGSGHAAEGLLTKVAALESELAALKSQASTRGQSGRITPTGSIPAPSAAMVPIIEPVVEMTRLDGSEGTRHVLGKRTRIGRAPGCELQVESSAVSRQHALVIVTPRDVIVEDLNSTNGVVINGRKVTRHVLHDGDLMTVGDAQFRLNIKKA